MDGFSAVSYLKQLVCLQLLGAEHDAVGVTSDPDGLTAFTQQHHVLAVFTVEPVSHACYYTHSRRRKMGMK